jgi:preprotein translocase subunit SecG
LSHAAGSVPKGLAVNLAVPPLLAETWWQSWAPPILTPVLVVLGVFLIFLVLIQSGKGGGLAGAFGGSGGSSAFGSRAGDTFTRVTIYVAAAWVLLIMILIKTTQPQTDTKKGPGVDQPNAPSFPIGDDSNS